MTNVQFEKRDDGTTQVAILPSKTELEPTANGKKAVTNGTVKKQKNEDGAMVSWQSHSSTVHVVDSYFYPRRSRLMVNLKETLRQTRRARSTRRRTMQR
jgi:hypothetical protein